jgi:uncharacterized membrane protein
MPTLLTVLTIASLTGSGLLAGLFFAFSAFVMRALARLPHPQGMAAMQSINAAVLNPVFALAFFGTAITSLALIVGVLLAPTSGRVYLIAGSLLYLAGSIAVTFACNIPRNERLARLNAATAPPDEWTRYVREWTAWNHVRTATCLAAAVSLTGGLFRLGGS